MKVVPWKHAHAAFCMIRHVKREKLQHGPHSVMSSCVCVRACMQKVRLTGKASVPSRIMEKTQTRHMHANDAFLPSRSTGPALGFFLAPNDEMITWVLLPDTALCSYAMLPAGSYLLRSTQKTLYASPTVHICPSSCMGMVLQKSPVNTSWSLERSSWQPQCTASPCEMLMMSNWSVTSTN